MMSLKKELLGAVGKLRKIDPQSIHSNHFEFLKNFLEFIIKLDEDEVSQIINQQFFKEIMIKAPDYIKPLLHYSQDISSTQTQEVLNYYLQTIGSLEVQIIMTIDEDYTQFIEKYGGIESSLIQMNDYLRFFFNDPFLVVESLTKGSVKAKFRTDVDHAVKPFCTEKYKAAVGQFNFSEIERYDYPFKLLLQNNTRTFIERYIPFNFKERMKRKYIEKIMTFGLGREVSKHVYLSMDKSLLNYYTVCDVLLNYLRNVSNIEDMTKEEFYDELDLKENIINMIDEFLDSVKYSTPYCWLYFHILTLRDKMKLKYLSNLTFKDDINESDITIGDRKIRLFTVKSGVKFDSLFDTLKEKLMNEENKQWWYHGTSRASADNILDIGIETKYCNLTHDFGIRSAFYLGEDFRLAIEWALKKNNMKINDYGAVLIFKTDPIDKINDTKKPGSSENWKVWDLSNDEDKWKGVWEI